MREKLSMKLVVDDGLCLACGACVGVCAFNALTLSNRRLVVANDLVYHLPMSPWPHNFTIPPDTDYFR